MGFKPVIDIEVNDSAFRRFYELFESYSRELEGMPASWQSLGSAMSDSTKGIAEGAVTAKESLAIAAAQAGIVSDALKNASHAQQHLGQQTVRSTKAMEGLSKGARGVAQAISMVGGWIVKIAAIGGIGALLSGFGIGELMDATFSRGQSAGKLGITPGQEASFKINAAEFLPTSALEAAANTQIDVRKTAALGLLNIGFPAAQAMPTIKLPFEELKAALKRWNYDKAHGIFQMTDPVIGAYKQLGGTIDEIRNAASLGLPALQRAEMRTLRDASSMGFDKKTRQELFLLNRTLAKARITIESSLIKALAPLAPQIAVLAKDVAGFITTLINSKNLKIAVDDLTTAFKGLEKSLSWLVKTLEKPKHNVPGWVHTKSGRPVFSPLEFASVETRKAMIKGLEVDYQHSLVNASVKGIQAAWHWLTGTPRKTSSVIVETAARAGVDPMLALATAREEDPGLNPRAQGDLKYKTYGPPSSFGVFQLHRGGELGGMTPEQAFDPATNTRRAMGSFQRVLAESPAAALNAFSKAARSYNAKLTHQQIMDEAFTPGMYAALAQRPAHPFSYAEAVNKNYDSLVAPIINQMITTVDTDIKRYKSSWMEHLPKDVAPLVRAAHLPAVERVNPNVEIINRALRAVLTRRSSKPTHIAITNSTSARVAVSVHGANTPS